MDLESYDKNETNINLPPLLKIKGREYELCELKTKTFYDMLVEDNKIRSRAEIYWENKIHTNPIHVCEASWKETWNFKLKTVNDIRLRNFNLKLLYNIVPVKSNLYKWNLAENKSCTDCNVTEDILHAFLYCKKVKSLWKWIQNVLQSINSDYVVHTMDPKEIIYCVNSQSVSFNLLNYIINCALFVIYKCIITRNFENKKYNDVKLKCMLQREVKNRINIENNSRTKFFLTDEIDQLKEYFT
jgi:hypothetical protein